jgi:hypothetical protein
LTPNSWKDAFKKAAAIAEVVPASMQEAAFHRALDQILGDTSPAEPSASGRAKRARSRAEDAGRAADNAERLIEGINRTAYPEIASAAKVLDRSLAILRLASRDFAIDGLTAPEIAKVLTDKFRQRTSRQAVTQALGAAHTMVDTALRGRVTVYRLMQEGEAYLKAGGSQAAAGETSRPTPTRRRRRAARPQTSGAGETARKKQAARPARRRGPKTALSELIDEGYFGQARTINEAQEQLRHKKGLRFTLQDLSPSLVRLLREGRLDRDRNASGQYEYRAK